MQVVKLVPTMQIRREEGACGIVNMPHCDRLLIEVIVEKMEERLETSHIVMSGNRLSGYGFRSLNFQMLEV